LPIAVLVIVLFIQNCVLLKSATKLVRKVVQAFEQVIKRVHHELQTWISRSFLWLFGPSSRSFLPVVWCWQKCL